MTKHNFLPPKDEFPFFYLLLEAASKRSGFLEDEKRIGYISIWYLHAFVKGLLSTQTLMPEEIETRMMEHMHSHILQKLQSNIFVYHLNKDDVHQIIQDANAKGILVPELK